MDGSKRTFLIFANPALPALQVYLLIPMNCTLGNIDEVFHNYLTLRDFSSAENGGSVIRHMDFGLRQLGYKLQFFHLPTV